MGAAATVLIVDDEPLLRAMTAEILTEEGFDVLEAASADEALAISRKRRDIIFVLTDLNLPGMNGILLAEPLRRELPPFRLIFTSGQDELALGTALTPYRVLLKPYSMVQLLDSFDISLAPT